MPTEQGIKSLFVAGILQDCQPQQLFRWDLAFRVDWRTLTI